MLYADINKYLLGSGFSIYDQYKIINDPVHGSISLHPVAMIIVDSPPFQRLRHIRQVTKVIHHKHFFTFILYIYLIWACTKIKFECRLQAFSDI